MADPDFTPLAPPQPHVERKGWLGLSLIWLIPLVALFAGLSLAVHSYLDRGSRITITFENADGLQPGKTEIRFKNVAIGVLNEVRISDDRSHVIAVVDLNRSASNFMVADTQFWVVRPRVAVGEVSGLTTLLSGAFIAMDAGDSKTPQRDFTGLETPPLVLHGEKGVTFTLHALDLGSLDFGSPVYYRHIRVGRVVGYRLDSNGQGVTIQIFINDSYAELVTTASKFWNASGIDVSLNANGLKLQTQSLATVISGGIAFESDPDIKVTSRPSGETFTLFPDEASALAKPDTNSMQVIMRFDQSVRGLSVGSPIDFLGVTLGTVSAISFDYDQVKHRFPSIVAATIYPSRLGSAYTALVKSDPNHVVDNKGFIKTLIDSGLRAQLRVGNLLTGQIYVALDFVPHPATSAMNSTEDVAEIPTVPSTLEELQPRLVEIVRKLGDVPFDQIGRNLRDTLAALGSMVRQVSPATVQSLAEVQHTLQQVDQNLLAPDAPAQRNLNQSLDELRRAAQSVRALTDYLQRHPESLIRGRPAGENSSATTTQEGK